MASRQHIPSLEAGIAVHADVYLVGMWTPFVPINCIYVSRDTSGNIGNVCGARYLTSLFLKPSWDDCMLRLRS